MSKKLFSRRYRPAWIVLAVIVLLAVSMAFAPVRAIANSFLGLFRVQQFTVVEVNPAALPNQLGSSSQFESMLSQDVQFTESGPSQSVASPAEASALAGMPVRLPEKIKGTPQLTVQPGGKAVFNVNLQHVQAILAELGRSDVQVPELLEGATVSLEVPTSVVATYGNCGFDAENARQQGYDPDRPETPRLPACTTLVQMPSPTIQAPPGLDLSQIGQAYLQLLGMSPDEAAHFAQNIDWTTTFVIPLPLYSATYRDVPVDGVTGTLIMQNVQDHVAQYMLLWVKDDVVYALIGPGNGSTAVTIASSLK